MAFPMLFLPNLPTSMVTFFRNEGYFIFVFFALPSIVLVTCLVLKKIVIEVKFQGDIDEIIWINKALIFGGTGLLKGTCLEFFLMILKSDLKLFTTS